MRSTRRDKYETRGMIVNYGIRADRFYAGSPVYTPDNIFDTDWWRIGVPEKLLDSLMQVYPDRVWPAQVNSMDDVPDDPLTPDDIAALYPHRRSERLVETLAARGYFARDLVEHEVLLQLRSLLQHATG